MTVIANAQPLSFKRLLWLVLEELNDASSHPQKCQPRNVLSYYAILLQTIFLLLPANNEYDGLMTM